MSTTFAPMNTRQLAEYLRCSEQTIMVGVHAGTIPAIRVGPRCWRFDREAVLKALSRPAKNNQGDK